MHHASDLTLCHQLALPMTFLGKSPPQRTGQGGQIFGQASRSTIFFFLTRLVIGLLPPIARGFGIMT
jgi:hypothetical protein